MESKNIETILNADLYKDFSAFKSFGKISLDINSLLNAFSLPYRKLIPIDFEKVEKEIIEGNITPDNEEEYFKDNYNTYLIVEDQEKVFRPAKNFKEYYEHAVNKVLYFWKNGKIGDNYTDDNGQYVSRCPKYTPILELSFRVTEPAGNEDSPRIDKFLAQLVSESISSGLNNPGSITVFLSEELLQLHPQLLEDTDENNIKYRIKDVILLQRSGAPGLYIALPGYTPKTIHILKNSYHVNEEGLKDHTLLDTVVLVESQSRPIERKQLDTLNRSQSDKTFQGMLRNTKSLEELEEVLSSKSSNQKEEKVLNKSNQTKEVDYDILTSSTQVNQDVSDNDEDTSKPNKEVGGLDLDSLVDY